MHSNVGLGSSLTSLCAVLQEHDKIRWIRPVYSNSNRRISPFTDQSWSVFSPDFTCLLGQFRYYLCDTFCLRFYFVYDLWCSFQFLCGENRIHHNDWWFWCVYLCIGSDPNLIVCFITIVIIKYISCKQNSTELCTRSDNVLSYK